MKNISLLSILLFLFVCGMLVGGYNQNTMLSEYSFIGFIWTGIIRCFKYLIDN